jgi:hypothetical protein
MLEVAVPAEQEQTVLNRQSGDPDIVNGDHGSLASQLKKQTGIVECRLLVGK